MREAVTSDGLSGADLVEVALVNDPVEGEMIGRLLQNGGIPSILQPSGVNGPRIWLWSLAALGVAFGVFLLARAI